MSAVYSLRRWAFRMLQQCPTPPPRYGSPEWLALPEGSSAKVAAVVIAAEAWAREGDDLEQRLRAELDLSRRAYKAGEDAEYVERVAAHREQWGHLRLVRGAYADSPRFQPGQAS